MKKILSDLRIFHQKFFPDLTIPEKPFTVSDNLTEMRLNFMLEELQETAVALGYSLKDPLLAPGRHRYCFVKTSEKVDKAEALDGLVDLLYVLAGTIDLLGLAGVFEEAWDRVQAANLTKVRVRDAGESKRASAFDVRKPERWKAPELDDLVG